LFFLCGKDKSKGFLWSFIAIYISVRVFSWNCQLSISLYTVGTHDTRSDAGSIPPPSLNLFQRTPSTYPSFLCSRFFQRFQIKLKLFSFPFRTHRKTPEEPPRSRRFCSAHAFQFHIFFQLVGLIPGMPRAQRVVCLFEVSAGSWVFGSVELSWELSCAGSYRGVPGSFGGNTGPGAADGANERAILNRLYCLQSESVL